MLNLIVYVFTFSWMSKNSFIFCNLEKLHFKCYSQTHRFPGPCPRNDLLMQHYIPYRSDFEFLAILGILYDPEYGHS